MIVVLMGVSGSGKSTIGKLLARELGWTFVEADDFHPATNIAKMRRGIPLDDEDRCPWLDAIRRRLEEARGRGENIVLACSALKHAYQHEVAQAAPDSVRFVDLVGSEDLIRRRLLARRGHFMTPELLRSQLETLEPPVGAIQEDISGAPESIVTDIRRKLGL